MMRERNIATLKEGEVNHYIIISYLNLYKILTVYFIGHVYSAINQSHLLNKILFIL